MGAGPQWQVGRQASRFTLTVGIEGSDFMKIEAGVGKMIHQLENIFLLVIALLTVIGACKEIYVIADKRDVGFSALDNVLLPIRKLGRVSEGEALAKGLALLGSLGLGDHAHKLPSQMSGGQRQRVAIARALANNPVIILADEPTGALDSAGGEAIMGLLRRRCDEGAAAVLVTHEPRYAAWADRVVFLRDGAVVAQPSVEAAADR